MNTFKKQERLCHKKAIEDLMKSGSAFVLYPFRVVYMPVSTEQTADFPAQMMVSVSKKRYKRANKRNTLKRLIREAYRLNKTELLYTFLSANNISCHLMLSYIGTEILEFNLIEIKLKKVFLRLQENLRHEVAIKTVGKDL